MRILHTSDWHLGQHFYGKSRAQEHQQFLTWLLATVVNEKINLVIVAGDVFDTGSAPSYAREMYFDFITQLGQLDCQLVVVGGNHDSVAMLAESKNLLKALNTHVIPMVSKNIDEQVFVIFNQAKQAQAVICAIPFIRPRDVLQSKAGESATDKQRSLQQGISDHYQDLYDYARSLALKHSVEQNVDEQSSAKTSLPIIATGHLTTVGVQVTDSVREIYIGTLDAFPASAFPAADYIALGHIHRSQKVAKTEHIRYCGSPIPLSFDEAKKPKSVLIAQFNQQQLSNVTAVEIPCFQPLLMVKTNFEDIVDNVEKAVSECQQKHPLTEQQVIWLDIEIESAQYLSDLHSRINTLVANYPVEVLLVRRAKQARQAIKQQGEKITLSELSLTDVFKARLAQENFAECSEGINSAESKISEGKSSEDKAIEASSQENKSARLQTLFAQLVEQWQQEQQS